MTTMNYPFMVDPREFAGKRVLITGGTKGLGAAMARRFLAGGATVAVVGRRSPAAAGGPHMLVIEADVSAAAGCRQIIDRIQQEWGGVDILINNVGAGVAPSGGYESVTDEVWQHMLDVNFLGAVRLDRALVPAMAERKWGIVIHIGTLWARLPQSDDAIAYSAAKAALRAYSKGLAKTVAPRGVRVNIDQPGYDQLSTGIDRLSAVGLDRGFDRLDAAMRDCYIAYGVEFPRRIDDAPAFDDEIVFRGGHRGSRGRCGGGRGYYKLSSIHDVYFRFLTSTRPLLCAAASREGNPATPGGRRQDPLHS